MTQPTQKQKPLNLKSILKSKNIDNIDINKITLEDLDIDKLNIDDIITTLENMIAKQQRNKKTSQNELLAIKILIEEYKNIYNILMTEIYNADEKASEHLELLMKIEYLSEQLVELQGNSETHVTLSNSKIIH